MLARRWNTIASCAHVHKFLTCYSMHIFYAQPWVNCCFPRTQTLLITNCLLRCTQCTRVYRWNTVASCSCQQRWYLYILYCILFAPPVSLVRAHTRTPPPPHTFTLYTRTLCTCACIQIEHHCFPRMSSAWYPYIQPAVREVCKKHGTYPFVAVCCRVLQCIAVCSRCQKLSTHAFVAVCWSVWGEVRTKHATLPFVTVSRSVLLYVGVVCKRHSIDAFVAVCCGVVREQCTNRSTHLCGVLQWSGNGCKRTLHIPVLQYVERGLWEARYTSLCCSTHPFVAVCCIFLQCFDAYVQEARYTSLCCSVCCSVLQCPCMYIKCMFVYMYRYT